MNVNLQSTQKRDTITVSSLLLHKIHLPNSISHNI